MVRILSKQNEKNWFTFGGNAILSLQFIAGRIKTWKNHYRSDRKKLYSVFLWKRLACSSPL